MPIFLEEPSYGPGGPDGQGWNRLSLNAHFDQRHQCGLLPINFPTLFESMTGRQRWGGYERCRQLAPGHCGECPIQRRHTEDQGAIAWPDRTPLLLARVRPLAPTPGALFADPASGRSTLELRPWPGGTAVEASWVQVRNTPALRLSWAWRDAEGEAFWLVRNNPAAADAVVRSKKFGAHTRHSLYSLEDGPRVALLTCRGSCAHASSHLQHLAADLGVHAGRSPGCVPDTTERLPGVRSIELAQKDGRSVIRRHGAETLIAWDVPFDETTAAALAAHTVRLTSAT
ncbi:hypothetical protein OG689_41605 [Kitasatospora sp. NBC_00240]|uniref:hypothetical protein n=1 Tax=Kitasatospora sp. NBC_00240 TaxID=2903567 RepID=UPI002258B46F|nr:hypothetical protein [Kitasatospora sp. NBC_00240]MCX5215654.1 hypothetical protein [Kitasatospora sp. NBC_00240]